MDHLLNQLTIYAQFMKVQIVGTNSKVVRTNYNRVVSEGSETFSTFFYKISFFSAQLVSAQRLSALFPLRKFCSNANLK